MARCRAVIGSPYPLDQTLGLQYFITDTSGIGGRLRCYCEDFLVEELPKELPAIRHVKLWRAIFLGAAASSLYRMLPSQQNSELLRSISFSTA